MAVRGDADDGEHNDDEKKCIGALHHDVAADAREGREVCSSG